MEHDASDAGEARYELVISVDARRSGQYGDAEKPRMRERIYRILDTAFAQAGVDRRALYTGDRGDGVLMAVPGRIAVTRLLGLWMVEVHESLREENSSLRVPLGLRIAMHVGPVRHDSNGINGRAVDLAWLPRTRTSGATAGRRGCRSGPRRLRLPLPRRGLRRGEVHPARAVRPCRTRPERGRVHWLVPSSRAGATGLLPARPPGAEGGEDSGSSGDGPLPEGSGGKGNGPRPVDAEGRGDGPLDDGGPAAADDGRDDGPGPARYVAGGDLSVNRDNVYHQPVHIGRTVDSDRRKG